MQYFSIRYIDPALCGLYFLYLRCGIVILRVLKNIVCEVSQFLIEIITNSEPRRLKYYAFCCNFGGEAPVFIEFVIQAQR